MITLKRLGLATLLLTIVAAPAFASNETATRPWSAPVGHRQPRLADVPAALSTPQQIIDQEDAIVDRKIRGICRGC